MLPRIPFLFSDGETLTPLKLSTNFKRIKTDIRNLLKRRYTYSSFSINLNGITSATAAEARTIQINPPRGFEIIGVEVNYYSGSGNVITIESGTNSDFESFSLTGAGATTKVSKYKNQSSIVAANNDFSIKATQSAGTADGLKIIVHIRSDRFTGEPDEFSFTEFTAGSIPLAATLNTLFTLAKTIVDDSDTNNKDLRIQIFIRPSIAVSLPTVDSVVKIPDSGKTLTKMTTGVFAPVGNTLTGTVTNKGGSTVFTNSVSSDGALKVSSSTGSATQPDNLPETVASDWRLTFSRTGADVLVNGYVVLYWE